MKLRLVVAGILLLVAIGLPLAAVSGNGPPWGFRGHDAVVVAVVGNVEGTASDARRERRHSLDDKLDVTPNLRLDTGDELRVARLGQARLRFPTADVVAGDGARVVVGGGGVALKRGLLRVELPARAQQSFTVHLDGAIVVVRGGDVAAVATFVNDGSGTMRALVRDGSLDVHAGQKDLLVEAGRLLVVDAGGVDAVDLPETFAVTATCAGGRVSVTAPPVTQIFAAGTLAYPASTPGAQTGAATIEAAGATGDVGVLGRDVAGRISRVVAPCGGKT
jgi:hypothetical protein